MPTAPSDQQHRWPTPLLPVVTRRSFGRAPLPIPLTPMFGREPELAAVLALLRQTETRVLTVTGPGGVGKTRLALQAAQELGNDFADGVRYLPLASLRDPQMVLPSIARDLGLRDGN